MTDRIHDQGDESLRNGTLYACFGVQWARAPVLYRYARSFSVGA